MKARVDLLVRGVLAIILLGGFYVLALATAAVLLYIPYAEVMCCFPC